MSRAPLKATENTSGAAGGGAGGGLGQNNGAEKNIYGQEYPKGGIKTGHSISKSLKHGMIDAYWVTSMDLTYDCFKFYNMPSSRQGYIFWPFFYDFCPN